MPAASNILGELTRDYRMADYVYLLCVLTSIVCAMLLAYAYVRARGRILFWTALCFVFIALNNIFLYFDLVIFPGPEVDLSIARNVTAFIGLSFLVFGLIWEAE